jgi:glycosyltransferase involved in cell wall biosynthesis
MKISVLICLYNSTPYIKETLDSVFAQTYSDFEVIAVDDGSTDGTYEFIKENYADSRLKLFRKENEGLGKTRNFTMSKAEGEYFAFLDHDDLWMPEKLEYQVKAIEAKDKSPYIVFSDHQNIDSQGNVMSKGAEIASKKLNLKGNLFQAILTYGNFIGLSSVMINRKIYEAGTLFNDYKIAEEYEVWLKIALKYPADFIYVPEILYSYRIHDNCVSVKNQELAFNEQIIILKELYDDSNSPSDRALCKTAIAEAMVHYSFWLAKKFKLYAALTKLYDSLLMDPFIIFKRFIPNLVRKVF